ncbi:Hsp70 family protein [Micromonospora sp. CPCC 206060]|uniref:Hsp70 family protein n=1 Tax=Micromonospora sp. CPCC 206060 TaxID=3122406 RepID=UPI002FF3C57A
MNDATLAVDLGPVSTVAALAVNDGWARLVPERDGAGYLWPSTVAFDGVNLTVGSAASQRRHSAPATYRDALTDELGRNDPVWLGNHPFDATDLVAAQLGAVRARAVAVHGRGVDRLVLTVAATYVDGDPRRDRLVAAGERAGFADVELLAAPIAATLAPALDPRPDAGSGSTVLVYDLRRTTFHAALVRHDDGGGPVVVGRPVSVRVSAGGLQDRFTESLARARLGTPFTRIADAGDLVALAGTQAPGSRDDYLRWVAAAARCAPGRDVVAGLVAGTVSRCRDLVAAAGLAVDDIAGIVLAGGSTRIPAVAAEVARQFGRPVHRTVAPELAVAVGAAAWAGGEHRSRLPVAAEVTGDEVRLGWDLPDGYAVVARWLVGPGTPYRPGETLLRVRGADGALWDLRAPRAVSGILAAQHTTPGTPIHADDRPATVRAVPVPAGPVYATARHDYAPVGVTVSTRPAPPPRVVARYPHGDGVVQVAFDPTGRYLATACLDHHARIHDLTSGALIRQVRHDGRVRAVAFSPDGTLVATGSADATVRVHDTADGRLLASVRHPQPVHRVAFSPDGQQLATAATDDVVRVLSVVDGAEQARLPHSAPLWDLAFRPHGWQLATGCLDGTVRIWDLASGSHRSFDDPQPVRGVTYHPDGTGLAVTSWTDTPSFALRLYDADSGRLRREVYRRDHVGGVGAATFSPDGRRLAAVSGRLGGVHLFDVGPGPDPEPDRVLWQGRYAWCAAFSPDGRHIAVAVGERRTDQGVVLWQLGAANPRSRT